MSAWENLRRRYYETQQHLRKMRIWAHEAEGALTTPESEPLTALITLQLAHVKIQTEALEAKLVQFQREYPELAAEFDAEERKNK